MENRYQEALKLLKKASEAYYLDDSPIMSDAQYDELVEQLSLIEERTGYIDENSPNVQVQGGIVEKLQKVRHSQPMLSCQKSLVISDITDFMRDKECVASFKMDGLTIVLTYDNGILSRAVTRGDGEYGEDVTHNFRCCENIPQIISYISHLELRGEAVISWANFNKFNEENGGEYAHPRNVASGAVRQLNSLEFKKRHVEFFAFQLVNWRDIGFVSKTTAMLFLQQLGFSIVPYNFGISPLKCTSKNFENEILPMLSRKEYNYPTDGWIVEYDDLIYGEQLGATSHHPNNMFALKPANEMVNTVFRGIDYKTSRNGIVSLTAIFDDCVIDGTTVNRASVHNVDIYEHYHFGVGDKIQVYKANLIIPQVYENLDKTGTYTLIDKCPSCGTTLQVIQPNNTRLLYCPNELCVSRQIGKLTHFVSKSCMNIEGLSEATLQKLMDLGLISNYEDIYKLGENPSLKKLESCEGFGTKSIENLLNAINKSRYVTVDRYINALGIPGIGVSASKALAKNCNYKWDNFISKMLEGYSFSQISDFGEITNKALYTWSTFSLIEAMSLASYMIFDEKEPLVVQGSPISGKKFCITGSFKESRDIIKEKLESRGGIFVSSVSKKLDILFCGENAGSKLAKAQDYGIKIADEIELEQILGE